MVKPFRRFSVVLGSAAWVCLLPALAAHLAAQETDKTPFQQQLAHVDFAISGTGQFTSNTSGNTYLPQTVSLRPSNTLGALVTLRYSASTFKGAELNYGYARISEDYQATSTAGTPNNATAFTLGVQTNVQEYTLGYLMRPAPRYGVQPFASVGGGALSFKPTKLGGQGVQKQPRGVYYYSIGAEAPFYSEHFGLRVSFRQLFFGAPDFDQNYLANGQRSITSEPTAGFYVHF